MGEESDESEDEVDVLLCGWWKAAKDGPVDFWEYEYVSAATELFSILLRAAVALRSDKSANSVLFVSPLQADMNEGIGTSDVCGLVCTGMLRERLLAMLVALSDRLRLCW